MKPTPSKSSTSVRFTPEVSRILGKLAARLHSTRTYALEIAVREAGEKFNALDSLRAFVDDYPGGLIGKKQIYDWIAQWERREP